MSMLCGAFDDDRLQLLADHLVGAGWADPQHGLVRQIKQRCHGTLAKVDAGVAEPTEDGEGSRSGDASPADVADVTPETQPAARPNALSTAPAPTSEFEDDAQSAEPEPPTALSMDDAPAGGDDPPAQGAVAQADVAADDGKSIAPDAAATLAGFALAQPIGTIAIVDEPTSRSMGGEDLSATEGGAAADGNGEPQGPATTAEASTSSPNNAPAAPSSVAPRVGEVLPDCQAPRRTCRYSGCRPG